MYKQSKWLLFCEYMNKNVSMQTQNLYQDCKKKRIFCSVCWTVPHGDGCATAVDFVVLYDLWLFQGHAVLSNNNLLSGKDTIEL